MSVINLLNASELRPVWDAQSFNSNGQILAETSSSGARSIRINHLSIHNRDTSTGYYINFYLFYNNEQAANNAEEIILRSFFIDPGEDILVADTSFPIWLGPHGTAASDPRGTNIHRLRMYTNAPNLRLRYTLSYDELRA